MNANNLNALSIVAQAYAKAYLDDNREGQKEIVQGCVQSTPFETAYFCQQVVSHIPDVQRASMCLTVFCNQLKQAQEKAREVKPPLPKGWCSTFPGPAGEQAKADPLALLDQWNRKYYSFTLRADGNYQPGDGPHISLTAGGRTVSVGEYELVEDDEDKWPGIGALVAEAIRRWHADPAPKNFLVYATHPDLAPAEHPALVNWRNWHALTKQLRIVAPSEVAALDIARSLFTSPPSSLFAYEVDAEWKH
jgi:hypothetical protein